MMMFFRLKIRYLEKNTQVWLKNVIIEAKEGKKTFSYVGYSVGEKLASMLNVLSDKAFGYCQFQLFKCMDRKSIMRWCKQWIPHILRRIPKCEREKFFDGFIRCWHDCKLDIFGRRHESH